MEKKYDLSELIGCLDANRDVRMNLKDIAKQLEQQTNKKTLTSDD